MKMPNVGLLPVGCFLLLSAVAQARDDGKNELAACRADMEKYCRNIEPGEGRQMKCMYDLRDKLQPACAMLVSEKYTRFLEARQKKEGR
jgi:hypothetical protein